MAFVGAGGGVSAGGAGIGLTVSVWTGGGEGGAPIGLVRVHVVGTGPQTVQIVTVVVNPSGQPPAGVVVGVAPTIEVIVSTVRHGTVVNPVLQISVYVIVVVRVIVVVPPQGSPPAEVVVEAGLTGDPAGVVVVEVVRLEEGGGHGNVQVVAGLLELDRAEVVELVVVEELEVVTGPTIDEETVVVVLVVLDVLDILEVDEKVLETVEEVALELVLELGVAVVA